MINVRDLVAVVVNLVAVEAWIKIWQRLGNESEFVPCKVNRTVKYRATLILSYSCFDIALPRAIFKNGGFCCTELAAINLLLRALSMLFARLRSWIDSPWIDFSL